MLGLEHHVYGDRNLINIVHSFNENQHGPWTSLKLTVHHGYSVQLSYCRIANIRNNLIVMLMSIYAIMLGQPQVA